MKQFEIGTALTLATAIFALAVLAYADWQDSRFQERYGCTFQQFIEGIP